MKLFVAFFLLLTLFNSPAPAATPLVINGVEIGVGKFHRHDNVAHRYGPLNVWLPDVLPLKAGPQTPIVYADDDGSITVQFSTLEELLVSATRIASQKNQKISVLNINSHGMPGGLWFPKDADQMMSPECAQWRTAALAQDKVNYDQYYSPIPKEEILNLRATSNWPSHYACVVGLPEWKEVAARISNVKSYFTDDAQIHFLACLVGLGPVGEQFTGGVADVLLGGTSSMVKATINYGLSDWSMPEGFGFWDYINDQQLAHDNAVYPMHRRDRELAQKGTIRVASLANGKWISSLVADQDFMLIGPQKPGFATPQGRIFKNVHEQFNGMIPQPMVVRVPGTTIHVQRLK